jgi:hypothetical protein
MLVIASLLGGCGGSTPAVDSPSSGKEDPSDRHADGEASTSEGSDDDTEGTASTESEKPTCDDGTCSACGDGLCPSGWYCDESAPGGPACGWLPECAGKATCGCVKRAFTGCGCEDRAGFAHVRCG